MIVLRYSILYLLIFISFLPFDLISQKNELDFSKIKDTSQISSIIKFAKEVSKLDIDSAKKLFQLAERQAKKVESEEILSKTYYEFGLFYFINGRIDESFKKFQECHEIAFQNNFEKYLYASKAYIGTVFMFRSNYNLATKYTLDALKYYELTENHFAVTGILLNLTYIQIEQEDLDKAEEYADLSYKYAVLANSDGYKSKSLLNIGEIAYLKKAYSKALNNYLRSYEIADSIKFESFKSTLCLNISAVYTEMFELDSAIQYAEKVFQYNTNNDASVFIIPKGYILLSEIHELKDDLPAAILHAHKAVEFSDSVGVFQLSGLAYDHLSRYYMKLNDFEKAYKYKVKSTIINDSIFSEEKYRIQNDLETLYETSKKQKALDDMTNENKINKLKSERFQYLIYLLVFLVLISVTIAALLIRQNKIRAAQKNLELEQRLLRTQMNPHFIFNTLSAVQDFIINNNPLEASSYLSDFSKLMRSILMNSSTELISLKQEIETVETYLKLQSVRLTDKFNYYIHISDEVDIEELFLPPMLLQPFIENSIVHGIMKKTESKGSIFVRFYIDNNFLIIENEDDGIGREKADKMKAKDHDSKAVSITKQRIELLSEKFHKEINFEIEDLTDDKGNSTGTLVRFSLQLD